MNDEDLNQIKVIIVGTYSIGKTALLHRWLYDSFTNEYVSTIGAQVLKKKVTTSDQREVILNVWDTSGEERFSEVLSIFYNNSNAVFVCFDINNEESIKKIKNYVSSAHIRSANCTFFLVATRVDLHEDDRGKIDDILSLKEEELKNEYENHQFYSCVTSAKTGEGINELFQLAADVDYKFDIVEIDISQNTKGQSKCC